MQFAPGVAVCEEEKEKEKEKRYEARDGSGIERMACEGCGVRAAEWMVNGGDFCEGCYRDLYWGVG